MFFSSSKAQGLVKLVEQGRHSTMKSVSSVWDSMQQSCRRRANFNCDAIRCTICIHCMGWCFCGFHEDAEFTSETLQDPSVNSITDTSCILQGDTSDFFLKINQLFWDKVCVEKDGFWNAFRDAASWWHQWGTTKWFSDCDCTLYETDYKCCWTNMLSKPCSIVCCRGSKPLLFATNAFPKCFCALWGWWEDFIFFEPVVETLSDIANDDQEELPKGIYLDFARCYLPLPCMSRKESSCLCKSCLCISHCLSLRKEHTAGEEIRHLEDRASFDKGHVASWFGGQNIHLDTGRFLAKILCIK